MKQRKGLIFWCNQKLGIGLDKSLGIHYQLIAITIGLILFAGSISGSASIAFADENDKKEELKKFRELLKKLRDRHGDNDDEKKVLVCHIPPSNPENAHTISISKNALQTHLDHGDVLGKCDKYEDIRDKKDPQVKITFPEKNKKVEGSTITVTGTATDKLSGVESVIVRIDRGSYKTAVLESDGTWTVEFTDVDDGKHKVTVKAVDFAGNDKRKHVKFKVI